MTVRPEPIYLKDGSVYTSAGITAGIDLCLALVEEDHGHQVALNVARFLVMFLVRPGGQAQYSHMLLRQAITSKPLRELQVWMLENLRENLTVEKLAHRIGMSARQFTRVCLRETKMNPGQFVDRMRVEAGNSGSTAPPWASRRSPTPVASSPLILCAVRFCGCSASAPLSMLPGLNATPNPGKKLQSGPSERDFSYAIIFEPPVPISGPEGEVARRDRLLPIGHR